MQTLESNKKITEESTNPISLNLPDFTTDSYKDAYSRINAIVIEGEQEAHDNYMSIATLIPNELEELTKLARMEMKHKKGFLIVTLGRYSFSKFLPDRLISRDRGKLFKWKNVFIYPVYHPAAALRNSSIKIKLEQDFLGIIKSLKKIKSKY